MVTTKIPKLKLLRMERGIKQVEMAKYLGIINTALSLYENEHRKLPLKLAKKMAKKYKVAVKEILPPEPVKS